MVVRVLFAAFFLVTNLPETALLALVAISITSKGWEYVIVFMFFYLLKPLRTIKTINDGGKTELLLLFPFLGDEKAFLDPTPLDKFLFHRQTSQIKRPIS